MSSRFAKDSIQEEIMNYNRELAESGSNAFFHLPSPNDTWAFELHYTNEFGINKVARKTESTAPYDCHCKIRDEAKEIMGKLYFMSTPTIVMAVKVIDKYVNLAKNFDDLDAKSKNMVEVWKRQLDKSDVVEFYGKLGECAKKIDKKPTHDVDLVIHS